MKGKGIAVYWLAVLVCTASCSSRETKVQHLLLKGNLALDAGNNAQAAYYYREATKLDACFADAWNNLGTLEFRAGNYAQAAQHYDQALTCRPGFLPALFNRANTRLELREYFAALADVDDIAKQKADTPWVEFTQGLILTRMRRFKDAQHAFNLALAKSAKPTADLLVNRATVYYYQKLYDSALVDLLAAEQVNPAEANIYNTRALIYLDRGESDRALAECSRALDRSPGHPYYLNNRGFIYLQKNELEKAEADINESISRDPYNGWAYRNKGIFYLIRKDYASAQRLLLQAEKMDPFIDRVHFYLGQAFFNTNQLEKACAQFALSEQAGDRMVTANELRRCR